MGGPQPRSDFGFPSPFPQSPSLYTPHELMYMRQPSALTSAADSLYLSRYGAFGPLASSTGANGKLDGAGSNPDANRGPPDTTTPSATDPGAIDSNTLLSYAPKGRVSGMLTPHSPYFGYPLGFNMTQQTHAGHGGQSMRAPGGLPFSAFGPMISPYQQSPLDSRYPPQHGWSNAYASMFMTPPTSQSQDHGVPSSHPAASAPHTHSQ
jgi:hypothetical protein